MREWIVFWTYCANYAAHPRRVYAESLYDAIMSTYGCVFNRDVRYLVFEVGGDLAFDGSLADAAEIVKNSFSSTSA